MVVANCCDLKRHQPYCRSLVGDMAGLYIPLTGPIGAIGRGRLIFDRIDRPLRVDFGP